MLHNALKFLTDTISMQFKYLCSCPCHSHFMLMPFISAYFPIYSGLAQKYRLRIC